MNIPQLYVEVVHPCKGSTSSIETMQVNRRFELSGKYNQLTYDLVKLINDNESEYVLPLIYPEEGYTLLIEYGINDMIQLMKCIMDSDLIRSNNPKHVDDETQLFKNASNIRSQLKHIVKTQDLPYPYINLVIAN